MFEELEQEMVRLFLARFEDQVEEARRWLRGQLGPELVHDDIRLIPGGTGDWFAFEVENTAQFSEWVRFSSWDKVLVATTGCVVILTSGASHVNGRVFFMLEQPEQPQYDPRAPIKPEFDRTWNIEERVIDDWSDNWQDPVQFTLQSYGAKDDYKSDEAYVGEPGWWQSACWLGPYAPGYRGHVPVYTDGWNQASEDE